MEDMYVKDRIRITEYDSIEMREEILTINKKIYIVGAHSRAQTLAVYLQYLFSELEVEAYLYDNKEVNPERIGSIPVICIDKRVKLHVEYPVYIGTKGIYHKRLTKRLEEMGFKKIYPVTVELDLWLRNAYLENYYASIGREFIKLDKLRAKVDKSRKRLQAGIYVVKSIFDVALQQDYQLALYEKEIHAGAALTNRPLLAEILTDNTGDNISKKNKQYCELTALYWIWKQAKEDIVGLAHYRRHFIIPSNWMEIMCDNNVDVILPVPLYVLPNLADNYRERHDADDWDFLMQYLKDKSITLYNDAQHFFKGNLYSPCNMFITRREVLNEFCKWLFPILDAVCANGGEKDDEYLNRYPGFIAERLLTFFFYQNRDVYKIAYADKNFLR